MNVKFSDQILAILKALKLLDANLPQTNVGKIMSLGVKEGLNEASSTILALNIANEMVKNADDQAEASKYALDFFNTLQENPIGGLDNGCEVCDGEGKMPDGSLCSKCQSL